MPYYTCDICDKGFFHEPIYYEIVDDFIDKKCCCSEECTALWTLQRISHPSYWENKVIMKTLYDDMAREIQKAIDNKIVEDLFKMTKKELNNALQRSR